MSNLFTLDKETTSAITRQILSETPDSMLRIVFHQMKKEYKAIFGQPIKDSAIWERVVWLVFEAKKAYDPTVALHHLPFWLFSSVIKCAEQSAAVMQRLRWKVKEALSACG